MSGRAERMRRGMVDVDRLRGEVRQAAIEAEAEITLAEEREAREAGRLGMPLPGRP